MAIMPADREDGGSTPAALGVIDDVAAVREHEAEPRRVNRSLGQRVKLLLPVHPHAGVDGVLH